MNIDQTPQDDVPTFRGKGKKALYAIDNEGKYRLTPSSGWQVEEYVLREAIGEFHRMASRARTRIENNETSPIEFFMYKNMMDLSALSTGIGIAKWRIIRHMNPRIFKKLPLSTLERYASFFKTSIQNLTLLEQE